MSPADAEIDRAIDQVMEQARERSMVELLTCSSVECGHAHGVRLATWKGGAFRFALCDECHGHAATPSAYVEVRGGRRIRELGLHELHAGRPADDDDALDYEPTSDGGVR